MLFKTKKSVFLRSYSLTSLRKGYNSKKKHGTLTKNSRTKENLVLHIL